jgi:hypothetical protein
MSETDLVSSVIDYLRRCGFHVWRQNTGARGRLRWGTPGCGDITGILKDGRRLEIECKVPGEKQSGAQKAFQVIIEQYGGEYLVASSLDDVIAAVKRWRAV